MIRRKFTQLQDWFDNHLRRMCGRITPDKQLIVVVTMLLLFSVLSIYMMVFSIYNLGKVQGELLQIEHIQKLELELKKGIGRGLIGD